LSFVLQRARRLEQSFADEEVLQAHWKAAIVDGRRESNKNAAENILAERTVAIQTIHLTRTVLLVFPEDALEAVDGEFLFFRAFCLHVR